MTLFSSESSLTPQERDALEDQYDIEVIELWKEHADEVRKQVLRWGAADGVEAEDITQDAFLVARRRWVEWRTRREPAGYLYKTAKNILKWRRIEFGIEQQRRNGHNAVERPFGLPEEAILREDLRKALWTLPEKQRQAVVLRYFYDLDLANTAEYLGVERGTVKRYTHDGLKRLRQLLEGYEYANGADR